MIGSAPAAINPSNQMPYEPQPNGHDSSLETRRQASSIPIGVVLGVPSAVRQIIRASLSVRNS